MEGSLKGSIFILVALSFLFAPSLSAGGEIEDYCQFFTIGLDAVDLVECIESEYEARDALVGREVDMYAWLYCAMNFPDSYVLRTACLTWAEPGHVAYQRSK